MDRAEPVAEQHKVSATWYRLSQFWHATNYTLGLMTIILSALIASKPPILHWSDDIYTSVAYLLTVSAAMFAYLRPGERADKYRRAWTLLSSQLARYKADETYSVNQVLDARFAAEAMISPSPGAAPAGASTPV
jgi:hypothetical protein